MQRVIWGRGEAFAQTVLLNMNSAIATVSIDQSPCVYASPLLITIQESLMSPQLDLIPLGNTDLRVTPLGLGIWQWGDTMMWGYGKGYGDADLKPVYEATLAAGINFIDTAEMYGRGRSERVVGQFMRETNTRDQVVLATKFAPLPWRLSSRPPAPRAA